MTPQAPGDSLSTEPIPLERIPLSERNSPQGGRRKRNIQRPESPTKGILVAAAHAEPEIVVGLHVGCKVKCSEVQA
jgi:hypothetical protein